jgi:quercetin dioxygenase-like cupin family protein
VSSDPIRVSSEPILLKWEQYRRSIRWQEPQADQWGFHRGHYPEIVLDGLHGQLVLVPLGQSSPSLSSPFESVVVGVAGETEFYIGSNTYLLQQYDIIILDSNTPYTYANIGLTNALFFQYSSTSVAADEAAPETGQSSTADPAVGVTHVTWEENRRQFHWGLPLADTWGSHRFSGPHIRSKTLGGHLVRHPTGQSNPWHTGEVDAGVLLLLGESEFSMAGRIWPLKPLDILMIPANTPFIYTNVGLSEVLHLSFSRKLQPGSGTYYESDPGWPVRPDARKLDMARWPSKIRTLSLPK